MIRVFTWDDEARGHEIVEEMLRGVSGVELPENRLLDFGAAATQLVENGPWDVAVVDLLKGDAGEQVGRTKRIFNRYWQDAPEVPRSLIDEAPHPILGGGEEGWAKHGLFGVGLLLLAHVYGVPERFVMSGYIHDPGPKAAHAVAVAASSAALALADIGVLRSGALFKLPRLKTWSEKRLIEAIERVRRQRELEATRQVPDLYDVVLLEEWFGDASADLRVRITEKKTALSAEIALTGDNAIAFLTISTGAPDAASARAIRDAINRSRGLRAEVEHFSRDDVRRFIHLYGITLLGEEEGHPDAHCRSDNRALCEWRREGGYSPGPGEEGYECFLKAGTCPKQLRKERLPDPDIAGITSNGAIQRTKRLRTDLTLALQPVFRCAVGDELIQSGRRGPGGGGYVLAGTWTDPFES